MPTDPKRVQAVFLAAAEQNAEDRATLLDRECGSDAELRQRVGALLQAHDDPGSFLDYATSELGPTIDHPITEQPGAVIGRYKLKEQIGRGGMGVVYEAEQESLGRHVALKVLRSGFITGSKQLSRFEREARSAAQLHHTNIVPVFGVGQQGDTHYYVMQLIQGQPLDDVVAKLKWLRHQDRPATAGASNPERPPAPQHNDGREARVMALGLVPGQYPKEKDGHYPMIH
ncbi:MAG: protein kinase [Candidatus Nealsonbacteria bacterium]|nr:protein kinase [Candidatus Nealsonbacteria bacterium]